MTWGTFAEAVTLRISPEVLTWGNWPEVFTWGNWPEVLAWGNWPEVLTWGKLARGTEQGDMGRATYLGDLDSDADESLELLRTRDFFGEASDAMGTGTSGKAGKEYIQHT